MSLSLTALSWLAWYNFKKNICFLGLLYSTIGFKLQIFMGILL